MPETLLIYKFLSVWEEKKRFRLDTRIITQGIHFRQPRSRRNEAHGTIRCVFLDRRIPLEGKNSRKVQQERFSKDGTGKRRDRHRERRKKTAQGAKKAREEAEGDKRMPAPGRA